MKRIYFRGSLPNPLQLFAKQIGTLDIPDTEFWEMSSIEELEKKAVEIGYEIVPTKDMETERGYLVGLDAEEPKLIIGRNSAVKLKLYFIELEQAEFDQWVRKIKTHREQQLKDMQRRRTKIEKQRKKKSEILEKMKEKI